MLLTCTFSYPALCTVVALLPFLPPVPSSTFASCLCSPYLNCYPSSSISCSAPTNSFHCGTPSPLFFLQTLCLAHTHTKTARLTKTKTCTVIPHSLPDLQVHNLPLPPPPIFFFYLFPSDTHRDTHATTRTLLVKSTPFKGKVSLQYFFIYPLQHILSSVSIYLQEASWQIYSYNLFIHIISNVSHFWYTNALHVRKTYYTSRILIIV